MNKTVTVNISGYIFNIEEEAYNSLVKYLNKLKAAFHGTEGADEIVGDIESRIAELFQKKLNEKKQVITSSDVDEIVGIMGAPEDYTDEETSQTNESYTEKEEGTRNANRRIFRDPDDHILGGVCSGISHYFGIDPLWIRLAFVLTTLAIGGGVIAYIVLWIIVPEASSTAEKLQMKGEDVNVESIRRSVNESAEKLKSKFSGIADDIKQAQKPAANNIKGFLEQIFGKLGDTILMIGKVIVKLIGFFLIIGSIGLIIALIVGFVATDSFIFSTTQLSWGQLSDFFFVGSTHMTICIIAAVLLLIVPVLGLFYLGLRMMGAIQNSIRGFGISLLALFIIGLILAAIGGVQFGREFRYDHESSDSILLPAFTDSIHINVLPDNYFHSEIRNSHSDFLELVKMTEDKIILGEPVRLYLRTSPSENIEVEIYKSAHGSSQHDAIDRIDRIEYKWEHIDSTSTLNLSPVMELQKNERYRGQDLEVVVRIPVGKIVSFGPNMERIYPRRGRSNHVFRMGTDELEMLN